MSSDSRRRQLQEGDIVVHEKFGRGTITAIQYSAGTNRSEEADSPTTVAFDAAGEKKVMSSFLKLESEVHRIDKIRAAAQAYGESSVRQQQLIAAFGKDLLAELAPYLHRGKHLVHGVTPKGDWIPGQDYVDAAFSYYDAGLLTLEPIDFGIAIRVDNVDDDGACWVRVVLTLSKVGDKILASIGENAKTTIPVHYSAADLRGVCEMIFVTVLKLFTTDVENARGGPYASSGAIGFIRTSPRAP